ncbi:MAG TPA: divalent metal cation transporter, partial [Chthoniobacterales bacterium]|nr:divalent metal cation transporter [Chthoniobacterales bacterium]
MSIEITQFENLRPIEPVDERIVLTSGNERREPMNSNPDTITADQLRASPRGYQVRSPWVRNILTFLVVFGPGLIVMEADNDAGAVSTYTQAGAQYGLSLLSVMLLLLPVCYFIQEMVVRLGIATGRGHAAMIYERFG